jgi:glycosyltransferase involved in cell wall biosynthesis
MDENMARYISNGPLFRRFCRWYMRWLYFPLCDHHVAVSPHTAGDLHDASFPHRVRRGVWIRPMGADCRLFAPDRRSPTRRRWLEALAGAPEGSTLLLYVGRLAPEKNLDLLIDTMRMLEERDSGEFHLLIAGDGLLRAQLEQLCLRDLPGAVRFLGHVRDREVLADVYANCDVLVHPNPREPFGIAPLEAMASGLPIVGPDKRRHHVLCAFRQRVAGEAHRRGVRRGGRQAARRSQPRRGAPSRRPANGAGIRMAGRMLLFLCSVRGTVRAGAGSTRGAGHGA